LPRELAGVPGVANTWPGADDGSNSIGLAASLCRALACLLITLRRHVIRLLAATHLQAHEADEISAPGPGYSSSRCARRAA